MMSGFCLPDATTQASRLVRPEALPHPAESIAARFKSPSPGFCRVDSRIHFVAVNQALARTNGLPASSHAAILTHKVMEVLDVFSHLRHA